MSARIAISSSSVESGEMPKSKEGERIPLLLLGKRVRSPSLGSYLFEAGYSLLPSLFIITHSFTAVNAYSIAKD
jgi:hypothetical protein